MDKTIRAIRLFQDPSGWAPHYTETGEDAKFQPLCFGPAYIPFNRTL
jgi:1,2-dihydroxy-3-keto-5-methylthiopentene dioxygenase